MPLGGSGSNSGGGSNVNLSNYYTKSEVDALDSDLSSRISALENEISGITETITELNNMVV